MVKELCKECLGTGQAGDGPSSAWRVSSTLPGLPSLQWLRRSEHLGSLGSLVREALVAGSIDSEKPP